MSDKQPVLCPWCGETMEPLVAKRFDSWYMYYRCSACKAQSPQIAFADNSEYAEADQRSYQAAISRPPQKPMTLEQMLDRARKDGFAFWEMKVDNEIDMCYLEIPTGLPKHIWVSTIKEPEDGLFELTGYGVYFRCWDHYPTEEERNAAPWKT